MNLDQDTVAWWLNRLPIVTWDRFVRAPAGDDGEESITVYGWIARDDGRSDFVQLEFPSWADEPGFSTSSAEHSEAINIALYGTTAPHFECERVEDWLGGAVENSVRLDR